ncbi:MAG: hypothetical protein V4501_03165 [Pseudomonadota bacterium]
MTRLFVCFDTGNTRTILKGAKTLLLKDKTKSIKFLVIGVAAKKIFDDEANKQHKDDVIVITKWLTKTTLESLNDRALTVEEIRIVTNELAKLNPEYSIVGSSCFPNALVPYQIIEILTKQKQLLLADEQSAPDQVYVGDFVRIANFDFFQDSINNPLWSLLSSEWAAHISFLLAFAEEARRMLAVNNRLTCHAVSSPELDEMFEVKIEPTEINNTLQQLEISEGKRLLFISGSTVIEDDLALLQALHFDLKDQEKTVVRIGLHPGTKNMEQHVSKLLAWMEKGAHANFPVFPARIIIPNDIKAELSPATLKSYRLLFVNLTGNQVFLAASSVASAKPSTLATKGVVLGKPTYCLPDYVGLSYVVSFFKVLPLQLIQPEEKSVRLTKKDLQLPDGAAVDVMSDLLLERTPASLRR